MLGENHHAILLYGWKPPKTTPYINQVGDIDMLSNPYGPPHPGHSHPGHFLGRPVHQNMAVLIFVS